MTDIHIIAPFLDANGGDWPAIDLYLSLSSGKENNVQLWSPQTPDQALRALYPINEIKPYQGKLPTSGILYVSGALTEIGHWYEQAKFEKIIVIHNLFSPEVLYKGLNRLTLNGTRKVEIQYVSNMLKETIGLAGEVVYPLPHPERFQPLERQTRQGQFTVGRISRDAISKHHYGDPDFYRKLVAHDMRIKIIGGTCLKPWLADAQNIELLPEVPQASIPAVLNTLDCFYYRTALGIKEAFGLVVAEAMLCGLPVVCYRQGGYSEVIEHGVNGFLFDTEGEAFEMICELQNNAVLRQTIGQKARELTKGMPR
ncbi:MAG TPA: glycosyltransferase family 4 protein [Methylophilaceae bacterium]|nr:glycosyltransferase family 4 protein [Methylophilaceae bacterium]